MIDLHLERTFAAPRDLVWRNWTEPRNVQGWFATDDFTVTTCDFSPRAGASWRVEFRSPGGNTYAEYGVFEEVSAPERLVFTLVQHHGKVGPTTRVTVSFLAQGDATLVQFHQAGFDTEERRDGNHGGWNECFDTLAHNLAGEREVRALHARWFAASERKDLDAAMEPIASDVISYEHEVPLAVYGVDKVREVCARGFAAAPAKFRWSMPDLSVVVRGDIAIAWGFNVMQYAEQRGASRATRVFQRIDGVWKLIHQHLSFPLDPATGKAVMDAAL
jgi:uncharacterized protein YndB with AHSA1/START domain/ketosteroid isomerase-like protein